MLPRKPALHRSRSLQTGPVPHVVVGFAHVAVGALVVLGFLVFTLATGGGALLTLATVATAALAGASVLGGLWLADGQRRGAYLALIMDAARVLFLLFAGGQRNYFDLILNVALGVAVIWVLPQLTVEREANARLP